MYLSVIESGLALLIALNYVLECSSSDLCLLCPGTVRNESLVKRACSNINGDITGRCCLDNNVSVIGLDWNDCNLTEITNYMFISIATTLQILDISGNPLSNDSIYSRAFGGLTNLTTLILPLNISCNSEAWNTTIVVTDTVVNSNDTSPTANICLHPLNPCDVTPIITENVTDSNSTGMGICPPHSECVPDGPGLHQCHCSDGYYGYKCQLQGTFPYAAFFGSSVGGILVAMTIYWTLRLSDKLLHKRKVVTLTQE